MSASQAVEQSYRDRSWHDATPEGQWIAAAQAGDPDAREHLLSRYDRMIYRLARALTRSEFRAKEVVLNTFIQAFDRLRQLSDITQFRSWLLEIAVRQCLATPSGENSGVDNTTSREDAPAVTSVWEWEPNAERAYTGTELRTLLQIGMEQLNPRLTCVFWLRDVEGLSLAEIARILSLTPQCVKLRLLRARLQLRENLGRYLSRAAS